jgi:phosphate transport system permease protein
MSVSASPVRRLRPRARKPSREVRRIDRIGDGVLYGLCVAAALLGFVVLAEVIFQVVNGATLAISRFGLGFVGHTVWAGNLGQVYGGGALLYGTVVSSAMALLLAAPLGVAIGIYLSMIAPQGVRAVVGPLVEMLAAIPSVILGFWGLIVLAPFTHEHLEPFLHSVLGFIPLFGPAQTTGLGIFTAGLILTVMVVPIIAALTRDLFLTVPRELQDGALALGATRWETIRGVVLPSTLPGVAAAAFLGLGRALGEAIAVTQVIGAGSVIHASLFQTGDTLASRIAEEFVGSPTKIIRSSLFYLAVMLLVIGLATNLFAQWIGHRFTLERGVSR